MYIQLDDLNMYYYDNQLSNKPVLVFIHGLGENLDSWHKQIDYFKDNYRVVAMDLRGHGRTDDGSKEITITQFALDVVALFNALNINQAHIIGLSMGGIITQELAINHAKHLLTISLCDSSSFYPQAKEQAAARIERIKTKPMGVIADFVVRACLPQGYSQQMYDEAYQRFAGNRATPYLAATNATFSIDYRQDLYKISLPTLVCVGELDIVAPLEYSQVIHDGIKNSELEIISGAGHLSNFEKPTEFNHLIENFIVRACLLSLM